MDLAINKIIDECLNGENQKFFLSQHKNDIENWIRDDIQDDFYQGELVEIAVNTMKLLYMCNSDTAVLGVYNNLIHYSNILHWGISTFNDVVNMVSKYAKNGEKLFKLHYKKLNEKQLDLYNKMVNEHKGFYENAKEQ